MEAWYILPPFTAAVAAGLTVMALCSDHWTATSDAYAGLWTGCTTIDETQLEWKCAKVDWPHGKAFNRK